MMEDAKQIDQQLSLPEWTPSGTKPTDQQMNALDDPRIMSDHTSDSIIHALRTAAPGHNVDMARSATASALSEAGTQWGRNQSSTDVQEDNCGLPQTEKDNVKQADGVQIDDRNMINSTEEVLEPHTRPTHPPLSRAGFNFTTPTRGSRGWQTERHQSSPSSKSPWIPAGSPSVSRPGSANQSISFGCLSRTQSQTGTRPRRSIDYHSPYHEPKKNPSLLSEAKDAAMSRTEVDRYNDLGAAALSMSNIGQLLELGETNTHVASGDTDVSENAKRSSDPACEDLLHLSKCLQGELHQTSERCHSLVEEDLVALREDIDHLCTAWLTACLAVSVDADAIMRFQHLVTNSEIDKENRAAARKELTANELCRCISSLQERVQKLELHLDHKDEVIASYETASRSHRETLAGDDASRDRSADWQGLFEKERHYSKSLQAQFKQFKLDAERMYQPGLERKCRDLKADLTEAQDHNASLSDQLLQAQEQANAWQTESQQYKEEFESRTEQFDEQIRLQYEEMMGSVHEYQSKVNDSKSWDIDGLIQKNTRLERDQAMLAEELSRVSRTSAHKDDQIVQLLDLRHRDQRAIEDLRTACFTGNTKALRTKYGELNLSVQDAMGELREQQRQRREDEDTHDSLKEKVRQMRMGKLYPPLKDGWYELMQTQWSARWDVKGCLEALTAAERALLEEMEGRDFEARSTPFRTSKHLKVNNCI